MIHFCHFLRLGHLYWILVFSSHLVRPRHNFWYPYCLYLWEKNISWTKGGPFDFLENPNSTAGSSLWPIELKFFVVISIDHGNEKNCLANFSSIFFTFWTPQCIFFQLVSFHHMKKKYCILILDINLIVTSYKEHNYWVIFFIQVALCKKILISSLFFKYELLIWSTASKTLSFFWFLL